MRVRDLQIFVEVMRSGSISRTAAKMYLAQQSVSERIHIVERDLGADLFVRSARGMTPTPSGQRFLTYAERCLDLLDEGARRARDEADLRVGVLPALAQAARPVLDRLLAGRSFELVTVGDPVEQLVADVADGTLDLAVAPAPPVSSTLATVVLFSDPLVCAVDPASPLLVEPEMDLMTLLERQRSGAIAESVRLCARCEVHEQLARGELVELPVSHLPRWSVEIHLIHRSEEDHLMEAALAS
jgi:DNA-binding transcriptional LysR family regulator